MLSSCTSLFAVWGMQKWEYVKILHENTTHNSMHSLHIPNFLWFLGKRMYKLCESIRYFCDRLQLITLTSTMELDPQVLGSYPIFLWIKVCLIRVKPNYNRHSITPRIWQCLFPLSSHSTYVVLFKTESVYPVHHSMYELSINFSLSDSDLCRLHCITHKTA